MKFRLGLNAERKDIKIDSRLEGVGMIRSEYPCRLIEEYFTLQSCRDYVYNYVKYVCETYYPDEVWYRNADFIVQEINVLKGADVYLNEYFYMHGLRGVRRGLKFRETFKLELQIIAELSKEFKNLNILLSFIKDPEEFRLCLKILNDLGFQNKIGIMAEIPSSILLLEEFFKLGVQNVTIGVNDLTSMLLGTYRNSEYHDCNHPAVLKAINHCVTCGKKAGVEISVGGIINKTLVKNCEDMGVDWCIVNYSQLPEILDIPAEALGDFNQLNEIKILTKSKRAQIDHEKITKKFQ